MSINNFTTIADGVAFQVANPDSVLRYNGLGADVLTGEDIPVSTYAPITVDAGCLKVILDTDGLLAGINAYVATKSSAMQILWANTNPLTSDDSLILAWGAQCVPPKAQADIDGYFIRATALQATL